MKRKEEEAARAVAVAAALKKQHEDEAAARKRNIDSGGLCIGILTAAESWLREIRSTLLTLL